MKETVLITGGNGFIAKHLIPILEKRYNTKVLTRSPAASNEYSWNLEKGFIEEAALEDVNAIIHLSGSKLNDGQPMTETKKKSIYLTRIGAAEMLLEKLKQRNQRLKTFVSASAIGYYGFTDDTLEVDENGNKGTGFNADLCAAWEAAGQQFKTGGVADHASQIRVSLVLGRDGGILPIYENVIRRQPATAAHPDPGYIPWNHVDDMAGIFAFAMEHLLDGVYNSVAPYPASTQSVLKAIANQVAGDRYTIPPFTGQHLVSHKIINAGYAFKYPDLETAMENLYAAV